MLRFAPLIASVLVTALMLTGTALAVARGQPAAVGAFVLCTGHGLMTVHVDADGNPTGAPIFCPDCALSLIAAAGGQPDPAAHDLHLVQAAFAATEPPARPHRLPLDRRARAPPSLPT